MRVIKRSGDVEPLNLDKWHKVCSWACEGITGVSQSQLELNANVQFHDRIKTSDIMELTIKSAADLISEDTPNYQYVASRLVNYNLRKQVYGAPEPTRFYDHVKYVVEEGYYDSGILEWYTEDEFDTFEAMINHDRDFNIAFVGMEQFRGKYLVKNRTNGKLYETPQVAMMLIAMTLFAAYEPKKRTKMIKSYYDALSNFDISLPTPIMAGVRTPQRQFSSCVLIETADDLNSINATASSIVRYASQRAGIGIGAGAIRALGSPIRRGDTSHTGIVPFIKYFQAAVKSCAQGGIRMSSATANFPIWHYEIEDIIVLKNNKGIEDNRARHLDYCIQLSRLFYQRLVDGGTITLFSPADVPGLYDAFYQDQEQFDKLYLAAERNTRLRKKIVSAAELFGSLIQERKDTGRIYIMNVDHCNEHGSFNPDVAPIRMTNLCCVDKDSSITVIDQNGEINDARICDVVERTDYGAKFKVLARDIITGNDMFVPIEAGKLMHKNAEVLVIKDDATGIHLTCTPDHLVYTKNRGYIRADSLLTDDILQYVE